MRGRKARRTWELRAGMSIVRLGERQGPACAAEAAAARANLRGIYGRFTEGFDFPDLQDAAELLRVGEEMGQRVSRSAESGFSAPAGCTAGVT